MNGLTRRKVLTGVVVSGAIALAGCVSEDDGDGEGADDDGTDDGADDGDGAADAEVLEMASTTVDVQQGDQVDEITGFEYDGDDVVISGSLPAPDPCREAVVTEASVVDNQLQVHVEAEDVSEDQMCADIVATVKYELTVTVSNPGAVGSVVVNHDGGESHELTGEEEFDAIGGPAAAAAPGDDEFRILETMIETLDAGPQMGAGEDATVSIGSSVVTVEGTTGAPTPNYEAVLAGVETENGTVSLTIEMKSTLDEDEAGITVLGEIDYQVQLVLDDTAGLECVEVTHAHSGETFSC